MRDEPQNRPPWLRNLRSRREVETAGREASPAPGDTSIPRRSLHASLETSPEVRRSSSKRYTLLMAILLWVNILVLGCLCMVATQRVVP